MNVETVAGFVVVIVQVYILLGLVFAVPFVADPIQITGDVVRMDDVFVLKADPDEYHRL